VFRVAIHSPEDILKAAELSLRMLQAEDPASLAGTVAPPVLGQPPRAALLYVPEQYVRWLMARQVELAPGVQSVCGNHGDGGGGCCCCGWDIGLWAH
jgi:hypothetical protein